MRRYVSNDEDSARWAELSLREGDVVVSTRSKHGTTWVQAILLMLVHGPDLPAPLPVLSPWIDHLVEPIDEVVARLEAQPYRRVVKTHTPLDGIPDDPGVHYVVVARHPLDAAVSLYHQGNNIDRERLAELTGKRLSAGSERPDLQTWLSTWVRAERDPLESHDSLQGVMRHLSDAWDRRHDANVSLVHFADLQEDLGAEVVGLAAAVGLDHPSDLDAIVTATRFDAMRSRASGFLPDTRGVLRDTTAFFREGRSGTGSATLSPDDLATYHARVADLVEPDLASWLHR